MPISPPTADDLPFWVGFSHVPGVGPRRFAALLARFGSAAAAWRARSTDVATVLDARSLHAFLEARNALDVEASTRRAEADGHVLVPYGSKDYPARLSETPGAPFLLYAAGCIERLQLTSIAVVGTRRATAYGRMAARRIAGDMSAAGVAIASGLAVGIDAAAHGAAVDGPGGTIAVLGCGLDVDYPHANRGLRRRIERRGAVVTEHPPGTQPSRGNFPARNRVVSGMAAATVVVEAGAKSGALITARHALEQNRDVFAVPGSIFSDRCAGSNALLAAGAGPALCADDLLTALGIARLSPRADAATPLQPADESQRALLGLLRSETMHVDQLCRAAGLGAAETARALTLMEMKGWVQHMGNMNWMAVR